ncbi:MAG: SDR family oxidoreductase [Azospirillaceae bacterium]
MSVTLDGRAYVVTGAASGIGLGVAEAVVARGGRVLMVDLDPARLEETARRLGDVSRALALPLDVTEPDAGTRMAAAAGAAFGRLDGLVACAGVIALGPIMDLTPATWDRTLAINLKAVFFNVQQVARAMLASGAEGAIVTFSSTSAHGARPGNADYGVSKIGVDHLTRSFAMALAPSGIRVNAVSPGPVETPMWQEVDRERSRAMGGRPGTAAAATKAATPLGRFGLPADIASVVCFLLSSESGFVTGQVIEADGGFMLANP